jgi:hypothetical protein
VVTNIFCAYTGTLSYVVKSPKHFLFKVFVKKKLCTVNGTVLVCECPRGGFMKARNKVHKGAKLSQWNNITND